MGYDGKLKFDTGIDESGFNVGLDGLSSLADKGLSLLTSSFTAAFDGIKKAAGSAFDFIGDSVSTSMDFDASISNTMALMSSKYAAGTEEYTKALNDLSNKAQELGASTQYSASQVSDAFGYMALAGWDVEQQMGGIEGVLNLAASSGMELASASDMVTDYLSAFSMEAEDAGYFADMLAYSSTNSNTSVQGLGEAYKNCAANMNASGQSVETTTALLAKMADQGEKGSTAGTKLTAIMRDLKNSAEDGAIAIGDTSVAVYDSKGQMRDLGLIMADIQKATNGMTDEQRDLALGSSFTADSIAGVNLILNAGADSVVSFAEELRNCEGTAEDVAKAMNDNLAGDIKGIQSAFEGLQIVLGQSMNDGLRNIVQEATGYLQDLREAFVNNGWAGLGKKLGDSLTLALKNNEDSAIYAMHMGQQFVQSLAESLQKNSKRISQSLVKMITQGIRNSASVYSTVYTVGLNIITQIVSGLADNAVYITKTIISTLGKIVDSITENAPVLLQAGLTIIQALLDGISQNTEEIVTCIITLLNSLIECVNENIFVILDAALQIIFALADGLKANMPLLLESALQLIMALAQYIGENIPLLIDCAIEILQMLIQFVFDNLPMLMECALEIIMSLAQDISEVIPLLVDCAIEILQMLIQFVFENLPMLLECALGIIMGLVEYLLDDSTLNSLLDCAIEIITSLIAFIVNNLEPLLECAVQIISAIVMYIINNADKLLESAAELLSTLAVGLVSSAYLVIDAVAKLLADIWVKFSETDWGEIGHNIIEGVKNGFLAGFERVKETFNGAWDELKQNFCDFWDINSPSKVMADLSGYLPAGMGEGFKAGMPSALDDINSSLDSAASGIDIDSVYSQLQNLNLSQGAGAVPAYSDVIGQAYSHQQDSGLATSKAADTSNSAADGGNWTFPIYLFPNSDALDSIIVSAAARANIVSGGRSI